MRYKELVDAVMPVLVLGTSSDSLECDSLDSLFLELYLEESLKSDYGKWRFASVYLVLYLCDLCVFVLSKCRFDECRLLVEVVLFVEVDCLLLLLPYIILLLILKQQFDFDFIFFFLCFSGYLCLEITSIEHP